METSVSLLDSLRAVSDQEAWSRMVELYAPLIRNWLVRQGVIGNDVDDITQEVLTVVLRKVSSFEHQNRVGGFRSWLRTITVNCARDHWKKQNRHPTPNGGSQFLQEMNQLENPESELSQLWNQEHDKHVIRYLLDQIRSRFKKETWDIFERFVLDGIRAEQVATEFGTTSNAVFIAKSRVLAELRRLGNGVID